MTWTVRLVSLVRRSGCQSRGTACRVKDYRRRGIATLCGQVGVRLPRFRCAGSGRPKRRGVATTCPLDPGAGPAAGVTRRAPKVDQVRFGHDAARKSTRDAQRVPRTASGRKWGCDDGRFG